jgi:hypothetical protein
MAPIPAAWSVGDRQLRLRGHALAQHTQLMPQQQDLGFQPCLCLERRDQEMKEQEQELDHRCTFWPTT